MPTTKKLQTNIYSYRKWYVYSNAIQHKIADERCIEATENSAERSKLKATKEKKNKRNGGRERTRERERVKETVANGKKVWHKHKSKYIIRSRYEE